MTTPVVDKTQISSKTWRRHTDPPSLWIFVAISSVSLHLLIFWLMRSSNVFGLWFPQSSQAVVPIEFIEIVPSAESTNKPKLSTATASSKPKQSVSTNVPTAKTLPNNQDSGASILKKQEVVSQAQTKPTIRKTVSQPQPTPTTQPKPSFTPESTKSTPAPTPTPTPTPTIPVGNLPWNRRQEVILGKGKPLPNGIPSEQPTDNTPPNSTRNVPITPRETNASTPFPENPNTSADDNSNPSTESTPQNTTGDTSPKPIENTPLPTQNNPNSSEQTGSIVTITPLPDNEIRQLSQDLPDVLATYQGSNTKKLESTFIPGDVGPMPAQLIASLVIDHNGNFQQVVVIQLEPMRLQSKKTIYEQTLNTLFKNEQFTPAYNRDGSKPELSNLFVKIVIAPVSSN